MYPQCHVLHFREVTHLCVPCSIVSMLCGFMSRVCICASEVGTHFDAWAKVANQIAFRGQNVNLSQNVMEACSFDMKFTFVHAG